MRKNALLLAMLIACAAGQVACGVIEVPMTLALDEGSSMEITLGPNSPNPIVLGTIDLEGGVETRMSAEISLSAILFKKPLLGLIAVDDLLFAGTPFALLGIPTGEVCTVVDPEGPSGGSVMIQILDHKLNNASLAFVMDLAALIKLGNPTLAALIPDGFPLLLSIDSEADLTLTQMLALISGDAEGGLSITQDLDEVLSVELFGNPVEVGVVGSLTLSTVNEFPVGPLLDDCIALLGL